MLCKSSLAYRSHFSIEGLLGITLDNDEVFLVNINESVKDIGFMSGGQVDRRPPPVRGKPNEAASRQTESQHSMPVSPGSPGRKRKKMRKRSRSSQEGSPPVSPSPNGASQSDSHNISGLPATDSERQEGGDISLGGNAPPGFPNLGEGTFDEPSPKRSQLDPTAQTDSVHVPENVKRERTSSQMDSLSGSTEVDQDPDDSRDVEGSGEPTGAKVIQPMDFGELLASFEGGDDNLGDNQFGDGDDQAEPEGNESGTVKTEQIDDDSDDDIIVVKEEKGDMYSHTEQYGGQDYSQQEQDYYQHSQMGDQYASPGQSYQDHMGHMANMYQGMSPGQMQAGAYNSPSSWTPPVGRGRGRPAGTRGRGSAKSVPKPSTSTGRSPSQAQGGPPQVQYTFTFCHLHHHHQAFHLCIVVPSFHTTIS